MVLWTFIEGSRIDIVQSQLLVTFSTRSAMTFDYGRPKVFRRFFMFDFLSNTIRYFMCCVIICGTTLIPNSVAAHDVPT